MPPRSPSTPFVAMAVGLYVCVVPVVAAVLAYFLLYMSGGTLSTPTCASDAATWRDFWEEHASKRLLTGWVCVELVTTRAWLLYEGHNCLALFDGTVTLREWVPTWRFTKLVVVCCYALLLDASLYAWALLQTHVCDDLAELSPEKQLTFHGLCYHTADVGIVARIMHAAAAISLAAFTVVVVLECRDVMQQQPGVGGATDAQADADEMTQPPAEWHVPQTLGTVRRGEATRAATGANHVDDEYVSQQPSLHID